MIIEEGIKHIRMGKENNFIDKIILVDGTILQNMHFELNARVPSDEELENINKRRILNYE